MKTANKVLESLESLAHKVWYGEKIEVQQLQF